MKKRNDTLGPDARLIRLADDRKKAMVIEIALQSLALTKKDIGDWRQAWQMAISVDNPDRRRLYAIYIDALIDLHLSGCIDQRRGFLHKKSFRLVDRAGKENEQATELFESTWFKDVMDHYLDARLWGHALLQFGDVTTIEGKMRFDSVQLVPREHVRQEFGVIVREPGDEPTRGVDYRSSRMADWCLEMGKPKDLGLLLKLCPHAISKRNALAFWDQFAEIFGMPIRIGETNSRDKKELTRIEDMLSGMGAKAWGLFPEGTQIKYVESQKGDAFNVYDKRVTRSNSEMSKGILGQTMTTDDGSSLSQSETHLEVLQNIVDSDADGFRDLVNDSLIPKMIRHGFPVTGLRFDWDESIDYTPTEQVAIETMLLNGFDVDPAYFEKKYNVKILAKKKATLSAGGSDFFD